MTRTRRATHHRRNRRFSVVESLEPRIALSGNGDPYDIGAPTLTDVWVDPAKGDDARSGFSRDQALQSLAEAWSRIPANSSLVSTGYRILLAAGDYPASLLPGDGWMSERRGTASCPILIQSADGSQSARLHGTIDAQQDTYLYLVGLSMVTDPGTGGGGNVLHIANDDHILIRDCKLDGFDGTVRQAQETLKANQCQNVFVESSEVSGAFWFPLDFVAVQYGHILGCHVHDGGEDGIVLKGGSAEFLIQGNEVDHIDTIGITAGEGTGFEFMVDPWLQYEAYNLQIVGNSIHDVRNAGLAVRGGSGITITGNTLYRVGTDADRGSAMLLIGLGGRSCDGDVAACMIRHELGGWGPTEPGDGGEWIPNQNVRVSGNIFDNPPGWGTLYDTISIARPAIPPSESNIPAPARADDGLQIIGNIFFNGRPDHNLGVDDPATAQQLNRDNQFVSTEPPHDPPPIGLVTPPSTPITPPATPVEPTPPSSPPQPPTQSQTPVSAHGTQGRRDKSKKRSPRPRASHLRAHGHVHVHSPAPHRIASQGHARRRH